MTTELSLGIYRRLDNRLEGLSDDSPRALELHVRRKHAIHSAFDSDKNFRIVSWGDLDDVISHEYVELFVSYIGPAISIVVVPGLLWLGKKLAEKAVDAIASEGVKALVAKLRPKQEAKEILDIQIKMPDGTLVAVDPPDRGATISINLPNGSRMSIDYRTNQEKHSD